MGRARARPRLLPLQHRALRLAAVKVPGASDDKNFGLGPIPRDHMKLYSYYKPSLEAGIYQVYAEQNVKVLDTQGDQDNLLDEVTDAAGKKRKVPSQVRVWNRIKDIPNSDPAILQKPDPQEFRVIAPQFSLDPKLIDSYYPPDGHQDQCNILPHICFNDPHLPWERDPGVTVKGLQDPDNNPAIGKAKFRSMVPWLAVVVFSPDELRLVAASEGTVAGIPGFSDPNKVDINAVQNANGTFGMTVNDYLGLSSPISYDASSIEDTAEKMTAIFPTKDKFLSIFKNHENDFPDALHPINPNAFSHNIEGHKYLAHVRHVNTTGCPDAGIDQEGVYSILISSRTGSLSIQQPTPQICHLISIENIDSTYDTVANAVSADSSRGKDRIGLVSLFSWIYMVCAFLGFEAALLKEHRVFLPTPTISSMQ
jgi:hypothetical protein